MFYDQFAKLCIEKGVTANKVLVDCGISRTSVAKWKRGATPNGTTIQKLSDYFGVTTDYLLGTETEKAPTPEGEHSKDQDISRIERAKKRMSSEEWAKQMKIIKASFGDYFSDDYEDDDVDD